MSVQYLSARGCILGGTTDGNNVVDGQFYSPNEVGGGAAAEAQVVMLCPISGTFHDLWVEVAVACGGGESHVIDLRASGADTALTVTLGPGVAQNNSVTRAHVDAGEDICLQWARVGGPANTTAFWGLMFTPD